ncbi:basic helix-loop-helix ARNT-like protein 2 [Paramacrobiotus metropolitanus]|uniref:basic helix-loop-helix ARNT-like protein 2 n=1 Tax=Paramacrobiotus metropolitanus TaxID=2943436 RepID=UPI0024464685|nr:basic helix-loop-helix ARNT-like protein 2 [Paramacrobiotus metropolitanus]
MLSRLAPAVGHRHPPQRSRMNTLLLRPSDQLGRISHSEIEKRRRNKLNSFIYELATLLPKRDGLYQSKKLDKLSILRLSVHHVRNMTLKSTPPATGALQPMPDTILTDHMEEFARILMEAEDYLTFVIDGLNDTFLYMSPSAAGALEITQAETHNLPIAYTVHPDDIPILHQQFHISHHPENPSPKPVAFLCRLKTRTLLDHGLAKFDIKTHKSYLAVMCHGLLKHYSEIAHAFRMPSNQPDHQVLVVVGVIQKATDSSATTSVCRLSPHGRFLHMDDSLPQWLGYTTEACMGTSVYQYCHPLDVDQVAKGHRWVLTHAEEAMIPMRFVGRHGQCVRVVGIWRAVRRHFDNAVEGIDVSCTMQY